MLLYTTYHTVYRSYVDNIVFVNFQWKSVTTHDPVARCRQRHCNEWNWLEMVKNIHGHRPFYSTRFWLYTHTWILLSGASMRHVASLESQRGGGCVTAVGGRDAPDLLSFFITSLLYARTQRKWTSCKEETQVYEWCNVYNTTDVG